MSSVTVNVNNKKIELQNFDFTVLQLCENIGISIPRFCYHRELSIAGNCRICMVEISNVIKPVVSCATSISKNMNIFTNTELVKIARENVLELLLINHPLDCPICDQGGECDLQDQTMIYGSDRGRFYETKRSVEDKNFGPIIKTVMTRCIHCTRCVRYSDEIIGINVLGMMGRGKETEISGYVTTNLQHEMIGNIADICPVGALTIKPYAFKARPWELENVEFIDIFDSLGSNLLFSIKGNEVMRILPVRNDMLNREWITDKARFFYEGIMVNRLFFSLININNSLVHCDLKIAMYIYIEELLFSINNKYLILTLVGGELDLVNSFLLLNYANIINIDNLYINNIANKKINTDFRFNWLLNSSIDNFINTENLLFVNVNLNYECSVLNALLYNNIVLNEKNVIYYIGSFLKTNYNILHIGLGSNILRDIQKGKTEYCNVLVTKTVRFIESSAFPVMVYSVADYIKTFIFNKHLYSFIAGNSSVINVLESGMLSYNVVDNINNKKISFLHIFGEIHSDLKKTNEFIVFTSHHMPNKQLFNYNLFLPLLNFCEVSEVTNSIWLNNQLKSTKLFDLFLSKVGDSKTNEYYFKLFLKLIEYRLEINLSFNDKINLFFTYIEIHNAYLKNISSDRNIFLDNNDYFISIYSKNSFCKEVLASFFYKSDIYSINSTLLNSVFLTKELDLKKKYNYNNYISKQV